MTVRSPFAESTHAVAVLRLRECIEQLEVADRTSGESRQHAVWRAEYLAKQAQEALERAEQLERDWNKDLGGAGVEQEGAA